MQLLHRAGLVAQGGHLADHVEALGILLLLVDRENQLLPIALGVDPLDALRCDAKASEIELLQGPLNLVSGDPAAQQLFARLHEGVGERRIGRAGGMARSRFQGHGSLASKSGLLEPGHDGPGFNGLPCEEVGGSHQSADSDAARRQRGGHGGDDGRRARIVDAAGKEHLAFGQLGVRETAEQKIDHRAPEHEAGSRSDMTSTLPTFEDELSAALVQEQLQETRRRHVEVGRNAILFEFQGLIGPSPGDQCITRSDLAHDLQLLDPQLERHETEDADTPGIVSKKVLGLFEQPPYGVFAQHAQSQKGQTPGLGHLQGESGIVADPGHRPLSDRESGSLRLGQP